MTKISVLPEDITPQITDKIAIVTTDTGVTSRITLEQLKSLFDSVGPTRFRVSRNAALATGNGDWSANMAFDTEQYDTAGAVSSGVFTAPADGYYSFHWSVSANLSTGANERFFADLWINGVDYSRGTDRATMNTATSHGSDIVYMTAGQTAAIKNWCATARNLNVGNTISCFFAGQFESTA